MQGVKGISSAAVSPQVQAQRREKKEEVATGVGAAAGITACTRHRRRSRTG